MSSAVMPSSAVCAASSSSRMRRLSSHNTNATAAAATAAVSVIGAVPNRVHAAGSSGDGKCQPNVKERVMTTRTFDIGDVLSITTGNLVSRRHMGGVHDILDFMTGEQLFTHQLVRAQDMCQPALLAQHPQLADVALPDEPEGGWTQDTVNAWVDGVAEAYGRELPVAPLAAEDRKPRDPLVELGEMVGPERVIVVQVDES